jgi:DNA-binding CsgD family transcriptional regulator
MALNVLTTRERQVVELLISGWTLAQTATSLHIGLTTAKSHLDKAHIKLGANNRADLCRIIFEEETNRLKVQNDKYRKALEMLAEFPDIPGSIARTALK